MAHTLCENCLGDGAKAVAIGPQLGSQRDSYQDKLFLCDGCKDAILNHDLYTFQSRFSVSRTIQNMRTM